MFLFALPVCPGHNTVTCRRISPASECMKATTVAIGKACFFLRLLLETYRHGARSGAADVILVCGPHGNVHRLHCEWANQFAFLSLNSQSYNPTWKICEDTSSNSIRVVDFRWFATYLLPLTNTVHEIILKMNYSPALKVLYAAQYLTIQKENKTVNYTIRNAYSLT
jgi:hypothetical protein